MTLVSQPSLINPTAQPAATVLKPNAPPASSGSLSFSDVLDAVNPLQHIPVVSGLWRAATGSTISTAAKIAGDTLYGAFFGGAAVGLASSLTDTAVQQVSGTGITQHVVDTLSAITKSTPSAQATVQLVPDAALPATAPASANQLLADQLQNATSAILHPTLNPKRTNAEYARAQAFDAMHKHLVKMAV